MPTVGVDPVCQNGPDQKVKARFGECHLVLWYPGVYRYSFSSRNQRFQYGALSHQPSAISLMNCFFRVFADSPNPEMTISG